MIRRCSRAGVRYVSRWEGFSPRAVAIGDGTITIGYGTTSAVHPEIEMGDTITEEKAWRWLRSFLNGTCVPEIPRRFRMKQQEIDALASARYNLGGVLFDPAQSTLCRRLRSKEGRRFEDRCRIYREELPKWRSPGTQFEEGLAKRRASEVALATRGTYSADH